MGPSTVNLNHFRLLRVVGKGAFGKVRIVERRDTGLTFALKYIRKDEGQSQPLNQPSQRRGGVADELSNSCEVGKCTEHHTRTPDAGTSESPISV